MNTLLTSNLSVINTATRIPLASYKNHSQPIKETKNSITCNISASEIPAHGQRCKRGAINGLKTSDSFLRRLLLGGIIEFLPILRHINPLGTGYNRLFPASLPPATRHPVPQTSSTTTKTHSGATPRSPAVTSTRNPFAQDTISIVKEMNSNAVAIIAQSERVTHINRMTDIAIQQRNSQSLHDYLAELITRAADISRLGHQLTYLRCNLQQRLNQLNHTAEQHTLIFTINDLLSQARVSLGQITDLSTRVAEIRQNILHTLTRCNNGSNAKQRSQ
ncbi:MAG: hypothetical protein P4L95_20100 [Rouxiella aceris]|uniref:hypothetical protein n=1 Tax=Rouxiella aceris TaxID=2703884 RepID=UPI002851A8F5|nr:hypothetical protein [Rouxiella aceris]MDR3434170.1 hypothetical protein [Rouxiella aceris]